MKLRQFEERKRLIREMQENDEEWERQLASLHKSRVMPGTSRKMHWKGFLEYDDVIRRLSVLTTVQASWLVWLIIITGEVMTQCARHIIIIIGRCRIGCTGPAIVDISTKWWRGHPLIVMIVMMTTMAVNMVGTMTATIKLWKWWEWCKAMRMMMMTSLLGQEQLSGQCHFIQFHHEAIVALLVAN